MFDAFDVFKLDNDDQPVWEASVLTFDDAQKLVQQRVVTHPANYLIFAHKMGHTTVTKPGGIQIEIAPVLIASDL
jgi:hypothetical protein